ncbi:hypothetical protein VNI00_008546 [Paramarasmius palmivorus]|uniref:F-box domain-containing protein n=1 Tax=Paramarasmius palmivorus TaxID=297713 RepID=A0AAW0CZ64_9AGAR
MILPQSPFLSRLRTNFLPSPAEKIEIHLLILTRQERIRAIEDEITQLRIEKDELQSFVDDHLTLISPIRQAPVDVLQDIFHYCIPRHELPTPRALDAPLLLTRVCRLWRQVVTSTPKLWCRVHIALPSPSTKYLSITPKFRSFMRLWEDGVRVWLQRSGSMPLHLSIQGTDSRGYLDEESVAELETFHGDVALQLLCHAPRWKSLSLDVPNGIRGILTLPTLELPLLEEFKSRRHYSYNDPLTEVPSLEAVLRSAPSLHKLDLNESYSGLQIHWNRLTKVVLWHDRLGWGHVGFVTLSQAIQVLTFSSSSLRYCTLSVQSPETDDELDTFSPIILPNLHTLNIHVHQPSRLSPTSLQQALDSIHAPRLEDFYFGLKSFGAHPNLLTLLGFIESSGCTLRAFVLDYDSQVSLIESLINLLTSMPSIRQFKLRVSQSPTEREALESLPRFIHHLNPCLSNNDVLCPNIESLMWMTCPPSCAAPLLALAEARSAKSSATEKLKRLQVDFENFAVEDTEIPFGLEALRKGGMLIQWTMSPDPSVYTRQPDLDEYVHSAERWWPNDHVIHL